RSVRLNRIGRDTLRLILGLGLGRGPVGRLVGIDQLPGGQGRVVLIFLAGQWVHRCVFLFVPERGPVLGALAELLFDAQKLVVLRDAIAARGRAGLDLAAIGGHRDIGNRAVLGLATAMR